MNLRHALHLSVLGARSGRPLTASQGPVTADPVRRADWQTAIADLPASERPELASHWAQMAAAEHASVASFARVTLELMALGAPADLIADTQTAAADEVRHARICYGLASHYAGVSVGPGPLPLADVALRTDPRAVLVALIDEACVGETLAALEAAEAAERAQDATLKSLLTTIAEDEQRHAELAWRTLSWLLDVHPDLVPVAAERFRSARPPRPEPGPADLEEHGLLSPLSKLKFGMIGMREVVWPAMRTTVERRANQTTEPHLA